LLIFEVDLLLNAVVNCGWSRRGKICCRICLWDANCLID